MSDASVIRFGADNGGTDKLALFLKVFSGEVMASFEQSTVTLDKHIIRTIASGRSAQFPVIGRMPDAEYHTPGAEILGQSVLSGERVIAIDGLLISHVFIADIDEAMSHFDVRSRYSKIMGTKLGQTFDNHVFRELVLAARDTATITSQSDSGYVVTDADLASTTSDTRLQSWVDAIFEVAQNFDEKSVPKEGRYLALKPADYYFLVKAAQTTTGWSVINRDYGGEGSIADGKVMKIADINLIPTAVLPVADYSAQSFHAVNASTTKAVAWTEEAVGTVKLMDLSMQSEFDIRRQGTLMVARYAQGHGILRPECSAELRTAAPA